MIKINSRMSEARPDVLNDSFFKDNMAPLLTRLQDRQISVTQMQLEFMNILENRKRNLKLWQKSIDLCLLHKNDYIFWREDLGEKDITVSLLYLEAGEVHPPHHHNNVISIQSVAYGRIWAREYHRIEYLSPTEILIMPVCERLMEINDIILANEWFNNVHWFAATLDHPAVMWNCNVRGFEENLFLATPPTALGRILIDPHSKILKRKFVAKTLEIAEAYERFGNNPLSNWPIPEEIEWFEHS